MTNPQTTHTIQSAQFHFEMTSIEDLNKTGKQTCSCLYSTKRHFTVLMQSYTDLQSIQRWSHFPPKLFSSYLTQQESCKDMIRFIYYYGSNLWVFMCVHREVLKSALGND